MERMVIFIDARNLLGGQEEYRTKHEFTFGYREMLEYFSADHHIIRGYYYDGAPHKTQLGEKKERFFSYLRLLGITLRLKEIDFTRPNPSQKGVDIYLTTDMIGLAFENAYDIAVIVSGDGDYQSLIEFVKAKGKKVWVLTFKRCLSDRLREVADKVIYIDHQPENFRRRENQKR